MRLVVLLLLTLQLLLLSPCGGSGGGGSTSAAAAAAVVAAAAAAVGGGGAGSGVRRRLQWLGPHALHELVQSAVAAPVPLELQPQALKFLELPQPVLLASFPTLGLEYLLALSEVVLSLAPPRERCWLEYSAARALEDPGQRCSLHTTLHQAEGGGCEALQGACGANGSATWASLPHSALAVSAIGGFRPQTQIPRQLRVVEVVADPFYSIDRLFPVGLKVRAREGHEPIGSVGWNTLLARLVNIPTRRGVVLMEAWVACRGRRAGSTRRSSPMRQRRKRLVGTAYCTWTTSMSFSMPSCTVFIGTMASMRCQRTRTPSFLCGLRILLPVLERAQH